MPKVTIVKPSNTPEQEKILFREIERVVENIIKEEYGIIVKSKFVRIKE